MAISFNAILADVMSQLNALTSTSVSAVETAYTNAAAGTIVSTSTDWSVSEMKEAILDAEYQIIYEICFNPLHPERTDFNKTSNTLTTGDALPAAASDATPFLGRYSYVKDNTTGYLLLEKPLALVKYAIENTNSMFNNAAPNVFAVSGNSIFFKSTNAPVIVGPGAARTTFSGNIRCRDHHRPAIVAGALVRLLPKEGAWDAPLASNTAIWNGFIEQIRSLNNPGNVAYPSET